MRSVLSVVLDFPVVQTGKSRLHNVNDLAEQASAHDAKHVLKLIVSVEFVLLGSPSRSSWRQARLRPLGSGAAAFFASRAKAGGARRDRTDDLMLAKHALSQLSYDPVVRKRRLACQAEAQRS